MRLLKTFCTVAMISTCLSTSGNAMTVDEARQHARQHFQNNPVENFNGHIPLTGNDARDITLIQNPGIINSARSLELRNEFIDLLRHKTLTELFNIGSIDFTDTTLRTREEEKGLADLITTDTRLNEIIQDGIAIGDPLFTDIEGEQTESFEAILERAKKGSTVAAKHIARTKEFHDPFKGKAYLALQAENPDHLDVLEKLSENGSVYFQYHYLYLIHIEKGLALEEKMNIFQGMLSSAGTDFWGVYRYVDLLKKNIDSNYTVEMATRNWLDLFERIAGLPIGQDILMRQLRNEDGTPVARGYIDALYLFVKTPRSEPIHIVLRKIVEKTKTYGAAECYVHKFLYKLPDTTLLADDVKLTEVKAIGEIVLETKRMQAQIIASIDPEISLGYSAKTPEERRNELTVLANSGEHTAKILLAKANIGSISHHLFDALRLHLGVKDATETADLSSVTTYAEQIQIIEQRRSITQARIADILYLALNEPKDILDLFLDAPSMDEVAIAAAQFAAVMQSSADGISDALTIVPTIEPKSILRFNLEMNQNLGILPAEADLDALEIASIKLLRKHVNIIQTLTEPNDLTGGYINFFGEIGGFVNMAEKLITQKL